MTDLTTTELPEELDRVSLPDFGTGRRRSTQRKVKHPRLRIGFWLLILIGSLAGLAWLLWTNLTDSGDTPAPGDVGAGQAAAVLPPAPKSLLIQTATVDGQEVAAAFTVITLSATGPGGSIVFVPAETMVEIPGLRLDPLARAFEETGIDGAERTVRNLLGIDFDHVEVLDNETWASYVEPLGPLSVDNPGRLDTETDTLRIEVLYPAGPVTVDAPVVGEFLAAKGVSESGLLRLVRHQRFWEAFLAVLAQRPGGGDLDPAEDFEAFLDRLAAGDVNYHILPVENIGSQEQELYQPDRDAIPPLIAKIAPEQRVSSDDLVRVQILNGDGTPGLAQPVTDVMLSVGATVQLVGNANSFGHEITQIVYYRDEQHAAATTIRDALGVGEIVKALNPIDVVDVTVVVGGADFVDRLQDAVDVEG